ncbi:MAG: S46 family peptidase [Bacteroidales bacterium]|nr:S46 family peptidase [Bacteroidales bacterium]
MKKVTSLLLGFLITISFAAKADEGLWLLTMLEKMNMDRMQEMGLKLSAEDIYNINQSSIKDAVVNFGGFCTGEIVSDKGLIFTNHHCGEGAIHEVSTQEHNYLKNGFWAQSMEKEKPIEDLTVSFLVRMEDVTGRVNDALEGDMSEAERSAKIRQVTSQIEQEATKDTHYNANVKPFFSGNEFYLMVYETYQDVRLVGAPPKSIGNFGGDTDNWMWPRHTGDFSVFRVYAGPDGKPAPYSGENEPLKPDHHLPISLEGLKDGDFTMILGYPGGTDRYMTSYGVKEARNLVNPTRIQVREKILDIMEKSMNSSEELELKYSSKQSRVSNYYKYSIGQNEGLTRLDVIKDRQQLEDRFRKWVAQDEERQKKYGNTLQNIKEAYKNRKDYYKTVLYLNEALYGGFEIGRFTSRFQGLYQVLKNYPDSTEAVQAEIKGIRGRLKDFYKDYHAPTDRKLMSEMMDIFHENVSDNMKPDIFQRVEKLYDGNYNEYAGMVFDHSMFVSMDRVEDFLNDPSLEALENDPAFVLAQSIQDKVRSMMGKFRSFDQQLSKSQRLFMQGLREMQPDKKFYPDANFTMRLTYGDVNDYYPRDAVHYDYYTTLEGIMQKEDPSDKEFIVSDKLNELYKEKDYGPYGTNGQLHVCFISDNDITGGNSGSPVMNAEGELVGIAFDGNWEAMTGDIQFEPSLQRTISVDIRYVLFVIDKFAGADRLIEEMTIIK